MHGNASKRLLLVASFALFAVSATGCSAVWSYVKGGELIRDPNGPTGKIVVDNKSGYTLGAILLSDCGASTHGLNRLPSGVGIDNGTRYEFTVSPGCWDIIVGSASSEARGKLHVGADATAVYTVN